MLQAAHTDLLNKSNFVVIGSEEGIYRANPQGLEEWIKRCNWEGEKNTMKEINFIGMANYCKSLLLSTSFQGFDLQLQDVIDIWEMRLISMYIAFLLGETRLSVGRGGGIPREMIVTESMIKFEASTMLSQMYKLERHVNRGSNQSGSNDVHDSDDGNDCNDRHRTKILLTWLKFGGKDFPLVEFYYKEVFKARATRNVSYLKSLKFALIAVLTKRNELVNVYTLIRDDELMNKLQDTIESDEQPLERLSRLYLRMCLSFLTPSEPLNIKTVNLFVKMGKNRLYNVLAAALAART